jgi:hypothetical protein
MVRNRTGLLVGIALMLGSPGFAQDAAPGAGVLRPAKAHARKSVNNSGAATSSTARPTSEEADKAARLAEGRKKFFERSMGFDEGKSSDSPITLDGGGLTPAAGFKF